MNRAVARLPLALVAAIGLSAPSTVSAQRLTPATTAERCAGERIVGISFAGLQRDITDRFGALSEFVNKSAKSLQPQTSEHVVSRYLLLHEGDVCVEQRRAESERILRYEPFISDAVIRVEHVGDGQVRLRVETIDEYVLFLAAWGLSGVPVGFEVGTGNLFGGAHALAGTVELGRGGDVGGGVKYANYQAFGEPLLLQMNVASRPLAHYGSVSLRRPFLTNFQTTSWQIGAGYSRLFVTFHDPTFRDVSLDYSRRSWIIGGNRRELNVRGGVNFGLVAAGESADPLQTVAIRGSGPIPTPAPALLLRYQAFESARVGFSTGYSSIRFLPVRGLDYLSAPQDVILGWGASFIGLTSLNVNARESRDWIGVFSVSGAAGNEVSVVRASTEVETRISTGQNSLPGVVGSGRVGWFGKTSVGHVTSIGVEFAGGVRTRLPLQLTFRDDDGLIGFRSQDFGGGQRTIARLEDRYTIPSPSPKLELAVAGLAQAGRLIAGDATYGVTTPWRFGVGVALIGAIPAGSKHTVRLEFGVPVNPAKSRALEFRIGYGDRTVFFGGEPSAISNAREAAAVAR
jgi:hypothetical protein